MGYATLVSIVPFPIAEFKPGIYPGFFQIPAARSSELPEILVVGESVYHVEIDENRTITVKCTPEDVAKSIVDDYIISNLAYTSKTETEDVAAPGVTWFPGKLNIGDIISKYSKALVELKEQQDRWFKKLIRIADDDWEKTRQHKFISDMQRFAAKSLNLERPWVISPKHESGSTKCLACQSLISVEAIICPSCKMIINMEKYKKLQFAEVAK